jgi:hypothetical protein
MSDTKTLYDADFVAWSKEQAEALRSAASAGSNLDLDWENLAEEVEGLGIPERRALHSQVQRAMRHLLKLQFSPATDPRRGWAETVSDARSEIEAILRMSPSLTAELPAVIEEETGRASRQAITDLERYGETTRAISAQIRATTYTAEQILGDWLPPQPNPPPSE